MRLRVRHVTRYRFDQPQARLVQLLRLRPQNNPGQSVVWWNIEVDRDARLREGRDGYGNRTTMLYVDGPLDAIEVAVAGEVLTEDRHGLVGGPEPLPPLAFVQPTPLTRADAAVAAFVDELGLPDDPLSRAHALNVGIHARLAPLPATLGLDQSAAARLEDGHADPQGMAHVLLAAARAVGMPARYVAGHLFRPDIAAGHAAHGWAELFVDGHGWIGFDPALGLCPAEQHVRVAVGLDHQQAAPVAGARIGGGDEVLAVDVAVAPASAAS